ncbi:unannotated protein [freshwater metagenome]|uniref:Unannotated protein n=1 Tax=freshwater metagenome TaxID=449393 RepID=A0A6J6E051_9ZZZZ
MPSERSASTIKFVSRERSGRRSRVGESARAASTNSRLVNDFDPGSWSAASTPESRVGAAQSPGSSPGASFDPYGSNSGREYGEVSIGSRLPGMKLCTKVGAQKG